MKLDIIYTYFNQKEYTKEMLLYIDNYIDKEFLRLWFVDNCDPYKDERLPDAPDELVSELSSRYIYLYEKITGELFPFPDEKESIQDRIKEKLKDS